MKRVGRRGNKIELFIILTGLLILGVDGKSANSGNIGGLHRAQDSIPQQCPPHALFLPASIDSKASQKHDRDGMTREPLLQSLGCIAVLNLRDGQTIEANDRIAHQTNIGLSCTCPLILQRMLPKAVIQQFLSAIEGVNGMVTSQLYDRPGFRHFAAPELTSTVSKKPGISRSACRRGNELGGASSAA